MVALLPNNALGVYRDDDTGGRRLGADISRCGGSTPRVATEVIGPSYARTKIHCIELPENDRASPVSSRKTAL